MSEDKLEFRAKNTVGTVFYKYAYTDAKVDSLLAEKQATLAAGTNIAMIFGFDPTKTMSITALPEISQTSELPVQSKTVYAELAKKANITDLSNYALKSEIPSSASSNLCELLGSKTDVNSDLGINNSETEIYFDLTKAKTHKFLLIVETGGKCDIITVGTNEEALTDYNTPPYNYEKIEENDPYFMAEVPGIQIQFSGSGIDGYGCVRARVANSDGNVTSEEGLSFLNGLPAYSFVAVYGVF